MRCRCLLERKKGLPFPEERMKAPLKKDWKFIKKQIDENIQEFVKFQLNYFQSKTGLTATANVRVTVHIPVDCEGQLRIPLGENP